MTPKISCLVVDDDEVDLRVTLSHLEDYPFLEVAGSYDSAATGLAAAQKKAPDALFLDIDMPGMNGLELREQLLHIPACIFITSYPDYALEGYDLAALDFLVKPFSQVRFAKTAARLQDYFIIRQKAEILNHTLGADTIFIKDGTRQVKLQLHEIIYFEALNNYTSIVTTTRKYAVLSTLGNLLKEEAFGNFIRIHRSFAVQKHFIEKIGPGEVQAGHVTLPVGRIYKDSLNFLKP
ncbi:MAG: LytTR family DNA-binding domain-containing protein [Bacteroidota bacterium]|nr:LytTR family DNA-binding domain-containing protein [Bacteroidota bacterium]MDP4246451.1 LytTR family DNA-binding domain-containing protein [Bacteroidota bacterium]MDP4254226.1 LytTR family DNA-binding domain-containing protein [Bacteroidota bacterium]MDP4260744.1 LytTR family DNA-binding domain-containing protein [Bacteroidota bacterium]